MARREGPWFRVTMRVLDVLGKLPWGQWARNAKHRRMERRIRREERRERRKERKSLGECKSIEALEMGCLSRYHGSRPGAINPSCFGGALSPVLIVSRGRGGL